MNQILDNLERRLTTDEFSLLDTIPSCIPLLVC
jgi:hypothetical protein